MNPFVSLPVIGYMQSPYREKFGIPRQPNLVQVESYIEMLAPYNDPLAFAGMEEFSHVWLIWQFHDNKQQDQAEKFRPQVRPPRLGGNKKIGVFATRSMYRPAPIGLSVVQLKAVQKVGQSLRVYVSGSDLLNGTPILDIKPYIHYSDAITGALSGYAQEQPQRKPVQWAKAALEKQSSLQLEPDQIRALEDVLSFDPRPAYQNEPGRLYKMKFAELDVCFEVQEQCIVVTDLVKL